MPLLQTKDGHKMSGIELAKTTSSNEGGSIWGAPPAPTKPPLVEVRIHNVFIAVELNLPMAVCGAHRQHLPSHH